MLSYCLKCKAKTESTDVKPAVDARGRKYFQAKCSQCGAKKAIRGGMTGEGLGYRGKGLGR